MSKFKKIVVLTYYSTKIINSNRKQLKNSNNTVYLLSGPFFPQIYLS